MREAAASHLIAVDIGGTFTDIVAVDADGSMQTLKIPSTRGAESIAVRHAIARLLSEQHVRPGDIARFVHGTTVATNAVLERTGARVGLLTTEGFRDVLEIGRQNRNDLYDLWFRSGAPTFLVPESCRVGVRERIGSDGSVVTPFDRAQAREAIAALIAQGVEAIAICFLFSFLNPEHERLAGALVNEMEPGLAVSLSSEVDPGIREYERTCATAFDAYVKPKLHSYLDMIARDLRDADIEATPQVIQSRGGVSAFTAALRRPGRLFLSGPAAGVIGGQLVGRTLGLKDLITIDIGGTSSDIALIAGGEPAIRAEGSVDGFPVRVPMIDVNAIGAGGGSIAWLDAGGGLCVGPRSAGAEPGPACYGKGGQEATVTDASVELGYIDPHFFAGGSIALDASLARRAITDRIARPLGLTPEQAALGIHRVVNAQMAEGIRLVSVKRGVDPRGFTLVPLGGGGALHATELAAELGLTRVAVPLHPGVLSAIGLLAAPVEHEVSAVFYRMVSETTVHEIAAALAGLDARCADLMAGEQHSGGKEIRHFADMCYVGQSYNLEVPVGTLSAGTLPGLYASFLAKHDQVYGHSTTSPARIVNLRAVHRASATVDLARQAYRPSGQRERKGARQILLAGNDNFVEASVWDRTALVVGRRIHGPAIIEQGDTTTVFGRGWSAEVGIDGSLVITRAGHA
jgi:N-methylhydantoinase A/oxoprolinase/acetone carboxylase beta subunit